MTRADSIDAGDGTIGTMGSAERSVEGDKLTSQRRNGGWRPQGPWTGSIPYIMVPVIYIVGGLLIPGFVSFSSVRSLMVESSFLGIAAVGETFVVISGGIDLSVSAMIGVGDVMAAGLSGMGVPFPLVVISVLAAGIVVGSTNGLISAKLGAHPLVITLAMNYVILGAMLAVTGGQTSGAVPGWLGNVVSPAGHSFGLAVPGVVLIWVIIGVLAIAFGRRQRVGRYTYALGANEVAADLVGIRKRNVWILAFSISAASAAACGILLAGFSGASEIGIGSPYLFTTIAAVVVGGTALTGGNGGYGRTIAGALIITELVAILAGFGINTNLQEVLLGALIIITVGVYGREAGVASKI